METAKKEKRKDTHEISSPHQQARRNYGKTEKKLWEDVASRT